MTKNLEYYLNLKYEIEIIPISESDGGGYLARIPQFGEMGMVGDGETPEEALNELNDYKQHAFKRYLDEGLEIPEPVIKDDSYNGKILLRVPKYLHRELSGYAQKNDTSLNQLIISLLSSALSFSSINDCVLKLETRILHLDHKLNELGYNKKNIFDSSDSQEIENYNKYNADDYKNAA